MVPGLTVRPQLFHGRHDERKQGRQELLQQVADKEVLLSRFADDRRRIDGIAPACDRSHVEHRVVVPQRVIPIVITERTLWPPGVGLYFAHQCEFGCRNQRVRPRTFQKS